MDQRYIMTAFGQDRVGIVADLTEVMFELGCNLEDSNMTRLANEFAVIFLFTTSDERIEDKLSLACRRLEKDKGLSAFFRRIGATAHKEPAPAARRSIQAEGPDQIGIVYKISRYLASKEVNIVNLQAQRSFSPGSGTALYSVQIEAEFPEGLSLDKLKQGLRRIADDIHVDIQLT
jgi:glycine cleavage system transcriptional repressor